MPEREGYQPGEGRAKGRRRKAEVDVAEEGEARGEEEKAEGRAWGRRGQAVCYVASLVSQLLCPASANGQER